MKRLMALTLGALFALTVAAAAQTVPPATPADTAAPAGVGPNFVDNDGDGICDTYQARGGTRGGQRGKGHGPGDGTGNRGVGPRDGSGYGAGSGTCGGTCDGTGPKGKGGRRGRRP